MSILKTITVDGFYEKDKALEIKGIIEGLVFNETQLGKEIIDFNLLDPNASDIFSKVLKFPVEVDEDRSGVFRYPILCTHFEEFDSLKDWCFAVAISSSTFNLFEHQSGVKTALDGYKFNYKNLFEWDLTVNFLLEPGQGVFFRPWLFHSFDSGLIQMFRLKEV